MYEQKPTKTCFPKSKIISVYKDEYQKIGLNILCQRRIRGMSQEQLAVASKVSRARISDIERGKETFKLDTLLAIAGALEINYKDLL